MWTEKYQLATVISIVAQTSTSASREGNVGLVQPTIHGEKPSTEVTPTANVPSAKIISQEDFDQLEKVNPLDAFDFLAQDAFFPRALENLPMFPLTIRQKLRGRTS